MQLRQSVRLLAAAGVLMLAAPLLASCGFDYATDRDYTPAAGVNDRDAKVDVLGAVVVSAQPSSGTFVASFSNNDQDKGATVSAIKGTGDDAKLTFSSFSPIEIPAGGLVNLATASTPVTVTGPFSAGDFLTINVTFGDGSSVDMDIPAVADCGNYAGLDGSGTDPGAAAASGTPCPVESPVSTPSD